MEFIQQVLDNFRDSLPRESRTAAAIARNASVEEISVCATEEGFHSLAAALFEAEEEVVRGNPMLDGGGKVLPIVRERLKSFRAGLPASSETARLIDADASLEEISEAAQAEGFHSLVAMLFEAEQEQGRNG